MNIESFTITTPWVPRPAADEPTKEYVDRQVPGQLELPLDPEPESIVREWPTEPAPVDPADLELDLVLSYLDAMPTWYDHKVVAVKTWIAEQLRDRAHRRVLP